MYGMTNYGNLLANELTNCLLDESGFRNSQFQMSIYYKYAPDGSKLVVLYYVGDCVYWYTSEELVNWFVDKLGKRFHVSFLGYAHWLFQLVSYNLRTIISWWIRIGMLHMLLQSIYKLP